MGNSNQKEYSGRILTVKDGGKAGTLVENGSKKPLEFDNSAHVDVIVGKDVIFIYVENHGQEIAGKPPLVKLVHPGQSGR